VYSVVEKVEKMAEWWGILWAEYSAEMKVAWKVEGRAVDSVVMMVVDSGVCLAEKKVDAMVASLVVR
jgi:hypothetical protein